MNKHDIIEELATALDLPKVQAGRSIDCLLNIIKTALKNGDQVKLSKFGTFLTKKRKERKVRNIKTGDVISIPAKRVPIFVPGQEFKDLVK